MDADKIYIVVILEFGCILFNDDGIESNIEKAVPCVKIADDEKYDDALLRYGYILYNSYGINSNKRESACYFKMAVDTRDVDLDKKEASKCYIKIIIIELCKTFEKL